MESINRTTEVNLEASVFVSAKPKPITALFSNKNPTIWALYKLALEAKSKNTVALVFGTRELIKLNTYVLRNMPRMSVLLSIHCVPIEPGNSAEITLGIVRDEYLQYLSDRMVYTPAGSTRELDTYCIAETR